MCSKLNFMSVNNGICCMFLGEKLTDLEVDDILKHIDLTEDLEGNVKYEGKCTTEITECKC